MVLWRIFCREEGDVLRNDKSRCRLKIIPCDISTLQWVNHFRLFLGHKEQFNILQKLNIIDYLNNYFAILKILHIR